MREYPCAGARDSEATVKWISFILLGSLTATFAFVALLALYDGAKHLRSWRGPVRILVGVLGLLGTAGFMGAAFASLGGLDLLGSFEWPIGHASGVVRLADGTYGVPPTPAGR